MCKPQILENSDLMPKFIEYGLDAQLALYKIFLLRHLFLFLELLYWAQISSYTFFLRTSERSGAREWSEQRGASERVSGASERNSDTLCFLSFCFSLFLSLSLSLSPSLLFLLPHSSRQHPLFLDASRHLFKKVCPSVRPFYIEYKIYSRMLLNFLAR